VLQACYVAIGWQPDCAAPESGVHTVHVANVQPELYPSGVVPLEADAALPLDSPSWLKYVQAAYRVGHKH